MLNKKNIFIVLIFFFNSYLICQEIQYQKDPNFNRSFFSTLNNTKINQVFISNFNYDSDNKKSTFLAVCFSTVLPGLGELYSGRFDIGQYSLMAETGLWLTFIGVNNYGNRVRDDGRVFAQIHAGFNSNNKDDDYYINISNFMNLYEYNEKKLRDRSLNKVYDPTLNMSWQWDKDENRQKFKDMRIKSDEVLNNIKYISIALIANRILSSINAARFTNQYNKNIEQTSLLFNISFGVTQFKNTFDGIMVGINGSF